MLPIKNVMQRVFFHHRNHAYNTSTLRLLGQHAHGLDKIVTCYRADGTATFFKCTRSNPSRPAPHTTGPNKVDYCRRKKEDWSEMKRSLYLNTDLPCPDRHPAHPAGFLNSPMPPSPDSPGLSRAVLVQVACMPGPLCNTDSSQ